MIAPVDEYRIKVCARVDGLSRFLPSYSGFLASDWLRMLAISVDPEIRPSQFPPSFAHTRQISMKLYRAIDSGRFVPVIYSHNFHEFIGLRIDGIVYITITRQSQLRS